MDNICTGIVTYNPILEVLETNIKKLEDQVDIIVIIDNHSNNSMGIRNIAYKYRKVELIENSDNYGIAVALNMIMNYAKKNRYLWVLTLDQDSIIEVDFVQRVRKLKVPEHVAIVCPCIFDRNRRIDDKGIGKHREKTENGFIFVDKCITSGAITRVDIWEHVGKYDEKLFMDYVDFDFCHRIGKHGYKIACVEDIRLNHSIGNGKICRFLLWNIEVLNHNAIRKYYISRNRVYCAYKYHNGIGIAIASNIKLFFKTLFFENDKYHKCFAIVKGIGDGIKMSRTGE